VSAYLDDSAPFAFAGTQARMLSGLPRRSQREGAQLVQELTQMREHLVRRLWLLFPAEQAACVALVDSVVTAPSQTLRGVPVALDQLDALDAAVHPLCRAVYAAQEARALVAVATGPDGEWLGGLRRAARGLPGVGEDVRWLAALTEPVVPVLAEGTAPVVADLRDLWVQAPELAGALETLLRTPPRGLPDGVTSVQAAGSALRATAQLWAEQVVRHYLALGGADRESLRPDLVGALLRVCTVYVGSLK
jgi:hypothetical protein